ncbi:MAG: RNase H family protein [Fervidobacterium sp.]|uniref:RNase H family protein n=1 Tax=Fervidobacterium sp. TaxID=1871331 RepID=UPI004049D038
MKKIACLEVYTDGSFKDGVIGAGGVVVQNASVILNFYFPIYSESLSKHRNVSGEIYAVMYSIFWAWKNGYKCIKIFHDYSGLAHWANGEWKANTEATRLYKAFVEHFRKAFRIEFVKVEAHSGNALNNMADKLAKMALEGKKEAPLFEEFEEFLNKFSNKH